MRERIMHQVPNCPYGFIYYVRSGDSIYSIANRFNLSVEALLQANPQITDPDVLYVGQPLCIPYPVPPKCTNGFIYVVQSGDSIYSISRKFGVSIDAILAANPQIVDPAVIYPGQKICIPYPMDVPECKNGFIYTVQPGDSLFSIANMFNVTVAAILAANPQIIDPNLIYPGQKICIPFPVPDCPEGTLYTVQPGDTIFSIAAKFNVTPGEILAANPQITDPNMIFPGQKICIPELPDCDGTIYTVKSGDTLSKIANANNVTLEELLAANPQITDPDNIFVGQKICIPESTFVCDGTVYIVKAGDTMYKIAQRYNIPLDELVAANPQISDPAVINPGQKICIPD